MRRYLSKIVTVALVIGFFVISMHIDAPSDMRQYATSVLIDEKYDDADPCSSGTGTTYYVNTNRDSLNVRDEPSTDGDRVTSYEACTAVKVYCQVNNWGKISKTSELYVSMAYLSEQLPSKCKGSSKTTTTSRITFNLEGPYTEPAAEMTLMYANKEGIINFTLASVKNLANDDDDLINISVYLGREDVTDNFTVSKSYSDGTGYITLVQANPEMEAGSYTLRVTIGKTTKDKSFQIVGPYYDFSINQEESGLVEGDYGSSAPSNVENTWRVVINPLVDATNYDAFTWELTKDGDDVSSSFEVEKEDDFTWIIKNKTKWSRPSSGQYEFKLKYLDEDYSTSRGTLEDTFSFKVDGRYVKFVRDRVVSSRYIESNTFEPYTVAVTRYYGDTVYYTEDGVDYKKNVTAFKKIYTDLTIDILQKDSNGYFNYISTIGTGLTITGRTDAVVTFMDSSGVSQTLDVVTFESQNPGVLAALSSAGYTYNNSTGNLIYNATGTKTIVVRTLSPLNQTIYAAGSGKFTFYYNYSNLDKDDFESANVYIEKDDGEEVDVSDGFAFEWGEISNGTVIMYLDYTGNDATNVGNYTIYIEMDEIAPLEVHFSLYDGEIDYYLTAQVDAHYGTNDPLETANPPGNSSYEWYLGLFLVQSGKEVTTKNNSLITLDIFDRRVEYDENGDYRFFDQIDYEVRIQSYIDGNVTYLVQEGNETTFRTVTESLSTFKEKYTEAATLIEENKYNFDSAGNLVSDNFELHIDRFYTKDGEEDQTVVFRIGTGTQQELPLATFRTTYVDMFAYLVTTFVFDADGNIVLGGVVDNYRVYEENGVALEGNEVTDLFQYTIDTEDASNVEKVITILPNPEVDPGTYYVYVTYDNFEAIGFVNNAEDAPISKEQFPDMWNQNIHMSSITYIDPVYAVDIQSPTYTNTGNESTKIYQNIEGTARFGVVYDDIHNYDGLSYNIQYYNGTTWVDANNHFTMVNSLNLKNQTNHYIELTTNPSLVQQGRYRLVINYVNGKYSAPTATEEFEISGKYYGLSIEDTKVEFIHNYSETKSILVRTTYVDNPNNIVPSITRIVAGANETYTLDKANSRFVDASGAVVFTYETHIYDDYYPDDPNSKLYEFLLRNVSNVTREGDYEIDFTYQEASNDIETTSREFIVGPDEYYFTLTNESARATSEGMFVTFDINTEHIEQSYLSHFNYIVYMYDFSSRSYIDVSSLGSAKRMFEISTEWDTSTTGNYGGKVILKLLDTVDLSGSFYMEITIEDTLDEVLISDLRSLFNWQISNYTIGSIYEGINYQGNTEIVQLDTLYNNLNNGVIDLQISTVYENDVSWVINKSCIDVNNEASCGPGGIDYNYAFDDNGNGSGKNKRLTISMKEDLKASEKLAPGTYSLVLYYSDDNFRFINFDVKNEFAEIVINDPYIYSEVGTNADGTTETAVGIFKNKTGYINMGLTIRGFDYDMNQLSVAITNAAGNDVTSDFGIDSSSLADGHELIIKYTKDTMPYGYYTITLSHSTGEEIISDAYGFTIRDGYFNFELSEPTYSHDIIYPNLENGGSIQYSVKTNGIPDVFLQNGSDSSSTQKHVIAGNTTITNEEGNDVTDQFTITASNNAQSLTQSVFDLNIAFEENAIEPGYYTIETFYGLYDYVIVREQYFDVGDYVKDLRITGTDIITQANDGRMHKNVNSIFRVHYSTLFDLVSEYLTYKVVDSDNNDVSSKFEISNQGTYIDFKYVANTPYIDSGDYTIILTYQEDVLVEAFETSVEMTMYGTYKDILLTNLEQSHDTIYADIAGQSYTFDVQSASMSTTDKDNVIFKIYDELDNIVYSDLSSDNVKNQFTVVNNLNVTDANVVINIEAFKARVGEYRIVAYLEDEDGEYNYSNALVFTIDNTYYRVTLSNQSYINPVVVYGGNKDLVYDRDGADMYFQFTSTYPSSYNPAYSIALYKDMNFYKEYMVEVSSLDDDGIIYQVAQALSGEIDASEYEFAICINGLPYQWITKTVNEYVPVTKATAYIGLSSAEDGGTMNVFVGQTADIKVEYEPENATDVDFIFTSGDSGIISFNNDKDTATVHNLGTTQINVSNSDIAISITAVADLRLASSVYDIDYENYRIFIKSTSTVSVTRAQFLTNLTGVVSSVSITNRNGVELTAGTDLVGTDWQIQNGNEKYTIVLIGDINRDAKITLSDVTMLYQHVRRQLTGKALIITDPEALIAARVRKASNLSLSDVSKLYQFVRKPGKMSL